MSNDKLLGTLKASENENNARIEKIGEEIQKLWYKYFRQELKEIKKSLYEIENKKDIPVSKKTKKYLDKLKERIYKLHKYYNHDDAEYRGIKEINNLFDLSIYEDYYKPIIVKGASNNNYIQYESKGNKDNILMPNEYLDMVRPYLVDMTNDHKSQSEWKIQLTLEINFASSKPDSAETRILYTKNNNIQILVGSDTNDVINDFLDLACKDIKKIWKKK